MTTIVELPDGSSVEVPTDDPKAAAAAARNYWKSQGGSLPAPSASSRPERTAMQTAGDFVGDVVDNVLPNWGDELAGSMDAAGAIVTGKPVGEAFERGQAEFEANQAQYDKEHPNLSWVSTLGGMGAGLLLPGGAVAKGAGMGAKVLQGAKIGAAYGALSGAGEGDGIVERGANTARSAAIGAGFGAVATPAITGAAKAGRVIRNSVPGVDAAIGRLPRVPRSVMGLAPRPRQDRATEQANRMVADAMGQGNIQRGFGDLGVPSSPQAIADEVSARQAMNVPAIPGDVTQPMRELTSWSSRGMGPGQTRVIEALERRKADEASRVRQHVIDTMGPVGDPIRQMEQHVATAKANAAPKYAEAYAQPMTITPEIQGIMETPAFAEAVPQALRNIRNQIDPVTKRPKSPEAMGLRLVPNPEPGTLAPTVPHVITPEGMLILDKNLSTEGFDQVIRAMRDSGRAAMDKSGFRPMDTTNSVHINSRARDLDQLIGDQNPTLREVKAGYADDMAQRDAFEEGQQIASRSGHEVNQKFRELPENAHQSWSIGARTALADKAASFGAEFPTGDTARAVEKALGDQTKRDAIGAMMGNDGSVRNLLTRLEAEHQGNVVWREVNANSRTAPRQALDADLDAQSGAQPLSKLSPRSWLPSIVDHLASRAYKDYRNAVKDRVAQIVTESDPKSIDELMQQIAATAERDKDFAHLLHRSGVVAAKAAGQNIEPVRRSGNWRSLSDVPQAEQDAAMDEFFAKNPDSQASITTENGDLIVRQSPE